LKGLGKGFNTTLSDIETFNRLIEVKG